MKCPICKSSGHIDIDLHADGFSHDVYECGDCGGIWTSTGKVTKIIKARDNKQEKEYSHFRCPTCKSTSSIEIDLDAFQFHEEIYECVTCGTVCSSAHDQVEVVRDSQIGSFLSLSTDLVEADDYVFV